MVNLIVSRQPDARKIMFLLNSIIVHGFLSYALCLINIMGVAFKRLETYICLTTRFILYFLFLNSKMQLAYVLVYYEILV